MTNSDLTHIFGANLHKFYLLFIYVFLFGIVFSVPPGVCFNYVLLSFSASTPKSYSLTVIIFPTLNWSRGLSLVSLLKQDF